MHTEYSYGIILFFKNSSGEHEFLLINQKSENGSFRWFPKWHIEEWETWLQAAKREVEEEVGKKNVNIIGEREFTTSYVFKNWTESIHKVVTFFVWSVLDKNVVIQESELNWYKWASFDVAINLLSHQNYKVILNDVVKYLNS